MFKLKKMNEYHFRQFTKSERSTFNYWYYHWKAFNLQALNLGVWRFSYLFHDIEKPWLKLFLPYSKVREIHRLNNKHHSAYKGGLSKVDWLALIIDNECSRFTKSEAQMTAREYIEYVINEKDVDVEVKNAYRNYALPILEKLGL